MERTARGEEQLPLDENVVLLTEIRDLLATQRGTAGAGGTHVTPPPQ